MRCASGLRVNSSTGSGCVALQRGQALELLVAGLRGVGNHQRRLEAQRLAHQIVPVRRTKQVKTRSLQVDGKWAVGQLAAADQQDRDHGDQGLSEDAGVTVARTEPICKWRGRSAAGPAGMVAALVMAGVTMRPARCLHTAGRVHDDVSISVPPCPPLRGTNFHAWRAPCPISRPSCDRAIGRRCSRRFSISISVSRSGSSTARWRRSSARASSSMRRRRASWCRCRSSPAR